LFFNPKDEGRRAENVSDFVDRREISFKYSGGMERDTPRIVIFEHIAAISEDKSATMACVRLRS